MPRPDPASPHVVLFDLGGVIVELGDLPSLLGPSGSIDATEFWTQWLQSPAVRDFEMGRTDESTFANGVVDEFGLSITADEFSRRFDAWPQGLFDGAADLLADCAAVPGLITATASNTNALHWGGAFVRNGLAELFDRHFPSFQLGLAKPDRPYFDHIVAALEVDPAAILFVDDNAINVEAAIAAGLRSRLTRGPGEARQALIDAQVLT